MIVTLVKVTMHAPHCHSLKERRAVVRTIRDKVAAKLKIRVAEVGGQDTWQRIELGFAVVGSDARVVDTVADDVMRLIEDLDLARVIDVQREQMPFGREAPVELPVDDWIPEFAKDDGQ